MKVNIKGKCSVDVALKFGKTEYLFGIDLFDWALVERKSTEHGYKSLRVLCFLVAKLDRNTFDTWLNAAFKDMYSLDSEESSSSKSVREDLM